MSNNCIGRFQRKDQNLVLNPIISVVSLGILIIHLNQKEIEESKKLSIFNSLTRYFYTFKK